MAQTGTTDSTGKVTIQVPAGVSLTVSDAPPAGYTAAAQQTGVMVSAGQTVNLSFQPKAPAGTLVVASLDQFGNPVVGDTITVAP